MRIARPSTLWRALLLELWRLLLLSAAVTVVVGVFAVTLRPLADGRIGPDDALKLMALAALPMLQYALPFAGGFAATMAYHRFATDNELVAAHAGGISHRAILFPAAATGTLLAGIMLLLTDAAIPRLLRNMDEILTQDVVRLVIAPIKRGDAIALGPRIQVFADYVASPEAAPGAAGSGAPPEQYMLSGVLAVETDDQGRVIKEAAARTAYLWIFRGGPRSEGGEGTTVAFRLQDASGNLRGPSIEGGESFDYVLKLPDMFADDPKFHSWADLSEMKRRPQRVNWIDRMMRSLSGALSERSIVDAISSRLGSSGVVRFSDPLGREVRLHAGRIGELVADKGYVIEPAKKNGGAKGTPASGSAGTIEIVTAMGSAAGEGGRSRVQRAARAWLNLAADEQGETRASIRLENVSTGFVAPGGTNSADAIEPAGNLKDWTIEKLGLVDAPAPGGIPAEADFRSLIAEGRASPNPRTVKAAADLDRHISSLLREITSKQQERLAQSAACLVMVICGAVMAIRLRNDLPLSTYLWSFLPGLATLLTISGGQRLTHQYGPIGLALLWGGVAALAVYTFVEYRKITRH